MTYKEAKKMLDDKKRGTPDTLKIARNTYLERGIEFTPNKKINSIGWQEDYPANAIGIRFHETYVAIMTPHWTELYSGGWHTVSTRDRMQLANVRLAGDKAGWNVCLFNTAGKCYRCEGSGRELPYPYFRDTGKRAYDGEIEYEETDRIKCTVCNGTGNRPQWDWTLQTPYFDGIRVRADGTALVKDQPHRPKSFVSVKTISGFTGRNLAPGAGRKAHEPYFMPELRPSMGHGGAPG